MVAGAKRGRGGVVTTPMPGSKAASRGIGTSDWSTRLYDPEDIWAHDGPIIGARSAESARNSALFAALRNSWRAGVVGPHGLRWRSQYQGDAELTTSNEERDLRHEIDRLRGGFTGLKSWDVRGLNSFRDMQSTLLDSKMQFGDSISVRVTRAPSLLAPRMTRARIIHPLRVANPPGGTPEGLPEGHALSNGVELDADGDPVALWISKSHPGRMSSGTRKFDRVTLLDDRGIPQVTWSSNRQDPEGLRGVGWIQPVAMLMRQLDGTTEAHVMAKRLQSCMGLIIESPDPARAAASDRNGEVFTVNTKFYPGKNYYVKPGTRITPFNFSYNGSDFELFFTTMAQQISAAFGGGLPWQYVLKQLTKSNMASSRTALMQAYQAFLCEGVSLQKDHLDTWNIWMMDELLSTGALELPTGEDVLAACVGKWSGVPRMVPDPKREADALDELRDSGLAESTVLEEMGYDFDEEILQKSEDQSLAEAQGVQLRHGGKADEDEDQQQQTTNNDDEEANDAA